MDDFELDSNVLSDFFSTVSSGKKIIKNKKESLIGDSFENLFWTQLIEDVSLKKETKKIKSIEQKDKIIQEELIIEKKEDSKNKHTFIEPNYTEPPSLENKDPLTPLNQDFLTLKDFNQHYKLLLNRIQQQLSTIGGGGETRLEFLDDVNRNSVKVNNKFIRYNSTTQKFEGADPGSSGVRYATITVTSASYTIQPTDYYIGVNFPGAVTITLPSNVDSGTCYVVKDELGQASNGANRYIAIVPSGSDTIDGKDKATIAYDYGSLTLIYKNGWRIV